MEEDLNTKLDYLGLGFFEDGTYDNGNSMTKDFIDKLLDEVRVEYGLSEGSKKIFSVIEWRLKRRISDSSISAIKNYVQGDILLIEEAISKGFDINKQNISQTLDEYYNSIYEKAQDESFELNCNIKSQENRLIAAGIPSHDKEFQKLNDMSANFNKKVQQALNVKDGNQTIKLKDKIKTIKHKIENKMQEQVVKNNPESASRFIGEELIKKIKKEDFEKQKEKKESDDIIIEKSLEPTKVVIDKEIKNKEMTSESNIVQVDSILNDTQKNNNDIIQEKITNLQDTVKEKEERVKVLTEALETLDALEKRKSELDKQIEELMNKINRRQL